MANDSNSTKNWFRLSFETALPKSNPFYYLLAEAKDSPVDTEAIRNLLKITYLPTTDIVSLQINKSTNTTAELVLVTCDTSENLHKGIERLESMPGLIGKVKLENVAASPPPTSERLPSDISQEALSVIDKGVLLEAIEHKAHNGGFQTSMTAYHFGKYIAIVLRPRLLANSLPKETVHNCLLVLKGDVKAEISSSIYGVDRLEQEKMTVNTGVNANAELGAAGPLVSPKIGLGMMRNTTEEKPLYRVTLGNDADVRDGAAVKFSLSKRARKNGVVVSPVLVVLFTLPRDIAIEDVRLDSHLLFFERTLNPLHRIDARRDTLTSNFRTPRASAAGPDVVIGGVIGYPQSGKTSFIKAIFESTKEASLSSDETPYLFKHRFVNAKLPNGDTRSFSFIDTRGYYFDADRPQDLLLLDLFVKGLPDQTAFHQQMNLSELQTNANNAVTHMILTVTARDAYKGVSWLGSFLWSGSTTPHLQRLVKLYYAMVASLAKNRYSGVELAAKSRVAILITHMDMIPVWQREEAKNNILSEFRKAGVPTNFVIFGQKNCTWKETDLAAQEHTVAEFLGRAQKAGVDYFEQLKRESRSHGFLHIDEHRYCQRGGCKHTFDEETQKDYLKLLVSFLNSP